MITYVCETCAKTYPLSTHRYRCECGSLLTLSYPKEKPDFDNLGPTTSLWRYHSALPPFKEETITRLTMGEGGTPLIQLEPNLLGKADYLMPTLSFKDRGAVMLVATMVEHDITHCAIDSSGNAATSVAAYAARVGIATEVFVPADTSAKKLAQIEAHEATVHKIEGLRDETTKAILSYIEETGIYYASHIFNPLFWEGTKTYIYEIFETLKALPEVLVIPVGNGTLLMGVCLALTELLEWHLIDKYPLVVAVQAAHCAPLATAYEHQSLIPEVVNVQPTLAEGIASGHPARGEDILTAMKRVGGRFVTVTEEEISQAQKDLARQGLYVEPTSAANYAGYRVAKRNDCTLGDKKALLPLCGSGLKSS
ncbi:MAG: threonine synthase [Sphaerochaeta sp.]